MITIEQYENLKVGDPLLVSDFSPAWHEFAPGTQITFLGRNFDYEDEIIICVTNQGGLLQSLSLNEAKLPQ